MATEMDRRAAMRYAVEKATTEGRAEGEMNGKLETAKALLANGIPVELVLKCTGLSEEQLREVCAN